MPSWYLASPKASRRLDRAALLLLFAALPSCASQASRVAARDAAAFRQVQVLEADITRETAALARRSACETQAPAPPAAEAAARICSASRALCQLSRALHDHDASARCLRAHDSCMAAREHSQVDCATQAR